MGLYAVGVIVKCIGVRGELKVRPTTFSTDRFLSLRSVALGRGEEDVAAYEVERAEIRNGNAVLQLKQIGTRTEAEKLVGMYVFVREDQVVHPGEGSYFTHDIIGCEVYSTEQRHLGVISDVVKMPGHDVWVLRRGSRESMIPAVKEFVKAVDVERRMIVISVIEGLIDE